MRDAKSDAARYQWLRDRSRSDMHDAGVELNWTAPTAGLDAAIDAAMGSSRAALAAPAPALDAPAELPDDIRVPLHRLWADAGYLIGRAKQGDTDLAVHTVKALCDEAERAVRRHLAARASQPTPAQDAQRCIDARNKLNAALHGEGAVINSLEDAVDAAVRRLSTPAQDAAATVPDGLHHEVSSALASLERLKHFTPTNASGCWDDCYAELEGKLEKLMATPPAPQAAPTAQAPALVPLTTDERTAAERLARYVELYLQEQCVGRVFDGAMAGHVSALHQGLLDCDKAGLLKPEPAAGTTPKEQQAQPACLGPEWTVSPPHPVLADASFCIAYTGEGACAETVHGGWLQLLTAFAKGLWVDGDPSHDPKQWCAWLCQLQDTDEWGRDEDGRPYHFTSELGETGHVSIYRLSRGAA